MVQTATASPADPLGLSVVRMLQHDIDLVVVVEDRAVVGVVRMTDVYTEVVVRVPHEVRDAQ